MEKINKADVTVRAEYIRMLQANEIVVENSAERIGITYINGYDYEYQMQLAVAILSDKISYKYRDTLPIKLSIIGNLMNIQNGPAVYKIFVNEIANKYDSVLEGATIISSLDDSSKVNLVTDVICSIYANELNIAVLGAMKVAECDSYITALIAHDILVDPALSKISDQQLQKFVTSPIKRKIK